MLLDQLLHDTAHRLHVNKTINMDDWTLACICLRFARVSPLSVPRYIEDGQHFETATANYLILNKIPRPNRAGMFGLCRQVGTDTPARSLRLHGRIARLGRIAVITILIPLVPRAVTFFSRVFCRISIPSFRYNRTFSFQESLPPLGFVDTSIIPNSRFKRWKVCSLMLFSQHASSIGSDPSSVLEIQRLTAQILISNSED